MAGLNYGVSEASKKFHSSLLVYYYYIHALGWVSRVSGIGMVKWNRNGGMVE
jgi:hypothetical protein